MKNMLMIVTSRSLAVVWAQEAMIRGDTCTVAILTKSSLDDYKVGVSPISLSLRSYLAIYRLTEEHAP